MNHFWKFSKKKFVIISLLVLIITLSLLILYYKSTPPNISYISNSQVEQIVNKAQELGPTGMTTRVKQALGKLNNPKLSDEQIYASLSDIYFYFSADYSITHNPKIREYINNDFNKYYKEQFPKLYNNNNYGQLIISCADPICGKNIDSDMNKIISIINNLNIDSLVKDSLLSNLKTAAYIPDNNQFDKQEKIFGFRSVINDLNSTENKNASEAAKMISDYLIKNYQIQ